MIVPPRMVPVMPVVPMSFRIRCKSDKHGRCSYEFTHHYFFFLR